MPLFFAQEEEQHHALTQSVACLRASLVFSEREEPEVQGFNEELDDDDDDAAAAALLRACHSQFRRSTGTTKTSMARRRAEDMVKLSEVEGERMRVRNEGILGRLTAPDGGVKLQREQFCFPLSFFSSE